jgi:hypothetical protein
MTQVQYNNFVTCDTRRLRFKRSFSDGNLEALDDDLVSVTPSGDIKGQIFGKYFPLFPQNPVFHSESLKSVSTFDARRTNSISSHSEIYTPRTTLPCDMTYPDPWSKDMSSLNSTPRQTEIDMAAEIAGQVAYAAIDMADEEMGRFWDPVKITDLAAEQQIQDQDKTTVMIRNIPCRYSQAELLEEIRRFDMTFDFLYLPPARHSAGNLGYAFINFVKPKDAAEFIDIFEGHTWFFQPKSKKRGVPTFATLQGFAPNVEYYSKMKISKSKNRPYVNKDIHPDYELLYCPANKNYPEK